MNLLLGVVCLLASLVVIGAVGVLVLVSAPPLPEVDRLPVPRPAARRERVTIERWPDGHERGVRERWVLYDPGTR